METAPWEGLSGLQGLARTCRRDPSGTTTARKARRSGAGSRRTPTIDWSSSPISVFWSGSWARKGYRVVPHALSPVQLGIAKRKAAAGEVPRRLHRVRRGGPARPLRFPRRLVRRGDLLRCAVAPRRRRGARPRGAGTRARGEGPGALLHLRDQSLWGDPRRPPKAGPAQGTGGPGLPGHDGAGGPPPAP